MSITRRPSPAAGFTLVELMVVVGIIAVLAGLLLPALSYGRFRAKVATCSNNYRQWCVASAAYASDDGKGRLPSFPLPTDKMTKYSSIEPWFVAYEMVPSMAAHGVTLPMWFCPLRPVRLQIKRDNFRHLRGREMATLDDMVDEQKNVQRAAFMSTDFQWWVPRRLGDSSLEFPDPQWMRTRIPDAWPRRLEDPTISTMPIISDWILGGWDDDRTHFLINGGSQGHVWGGDVRNVNAGFADGHVETRPKAQLRWQADGSGQAESPGYLGYVY